MKKNKWLARLMVLVMLLGAMNMTMSFAAEPGSDQDPLITLSYLNDTFMKQIMAKVDEKIAARNSQIAQQLSQHCTAAGWGGQGDGVELFHQLFKLGQQLTGPEA